MQQMCVIAIISECDGIKIETDSNLAAKDNTKIYNS